MVSTHLKNMLVKLDHFPRDENKKYLKPPPRNRFSLARGCMESSAAVSKRFSGIWSLKPGTNSSRVGSCFSKRNWEENKRLNGKQQNFKLTSFKWFQKLLLYTFSVFVVYSSDWWLVSVMISTSTFDVDPWHLVAMELGPGLAGITLKSWYYVWNLNRNK